MVVIPQQRQVAQVAQALGTQTRAAVTWLSALSPTDFAAPSVLPGWTVHHLTAHLVALQAELFETLDQPTSARPVTVGEYLRGYRLATHRSNELCEELAEHYSGLELTSQLRRNLDEAESRMAEPTVAEIVAAPRDPLRTADYLRTRVVEWVAHSDDLSRSLPGRDPILLNRSAMAETVRALGDALARMHPGRSVELRVPPFAAYQCGTGEDDPTHTRGTPPNVVECDPLVFVRLACGRQTFADALATHQLTASGTRADLTSWLPLL